MGKEVEPTRGQQLTPTTTESLSSADERNIEMYIIPLSVISGISFVLLLILVIIFIRSRWLKRHGSERVYSEPDVGLQAHYDYISALDDNKAVRPKLVDEYFEVADAIPFCQRGTTPASPAYAEVEQFAHLGRGQWLSLNSSNLAMSSNKPCGNTGSERFDSSGNESPYETCHEETCDQSGDGVNRRKGEAKGARGEERNSRGYGPKVYFISSSKQNCRKKRHREHDNDDSATKGTGLSDQDSISNTYESVGDLLDKEMTPKKRKESCSDEKQIPDSPKGSPRIGKERGRVMIPLKEKMLRSSPKISMVSRTKQELLSKTGRSEDLAPKKQQKHATTSLLGKREKPSAGDGPEAANISTDSAQMDKGKIPKQSQGSVHKTDRATTVKSKTSKDGSKGSSIVKNGILKFEQIKTEPEKPDKPQPKLQPSSQTKGDKSFHTKL